MSLPLVAIVGAPNVGKSTLFNRLVGGRPAIVTDEPGVTRDRQYGEVVDVPRPFRVVDTGGITPGVDAPFAREIERQAEIALGEAAIIVFVVDVRAGATVFDRDLAALLRRRRAPLIVVANKADGPRAELGVHEFHSFGLGEPMPLSAEHAVGVGELLERIEELLEALPESTADPEPAERGETIRIAIVGRPNVGKSSLLNRLAGEERVLVSEVPGTTRDAVDTVLEIGGQRYRLIDTAGIRRRGRIERGIERFSVDRAKQAIARCDVALLLLDGTQELAAQDLHVAGYISDAYKPMVVCVNKWDAVEAREEEAAAWKKRVHERLRFAKGTQLVLISALTGQRVTHALDLATAAHASAGRWIPTPELNRWTAQLAGAAIGRGVNLLYAAQIGVHPPRFVFFCNDPAAVHFSIRRHIENGLREGFDFGPAPIRMEFRGRRREGRR